jgi:hypothetical protein
MNVFGRKFEAAASHAHHGAFDERELLAGQGRQVETSLLER